jgi:hypothetical protein
VDLGYPACGEGALPEGQVVASGALRAGPQHREQTVTERFEIRRRGCVTVFTGHQEWSLSSIDLDVVFDAETGLPLRAWKRTLSPGPQAIEDRIDIRRFELRGERVAHTKRAFGGALEHWWIRGQRPTAILGPGRGLLTVWLQRARLGVGGRAREVVLDLRESMEVIRDVTLSRLEDREDPVLGRVRVYTIYGREPIFANDDDVVVGDMMGLVPADRVRTPAPPPVESAGPPDPVHTP